MLIKLSEALAVPVAELLQPTDPAATPAKAESQSKQLTAAFAKVRSPEVRAAILTLVTGLGQR